VDPGGKESSANPPGAIFGRGAYCILGVWNANAAFASNSVTLVTWSYAARPFGNGALPLTAPVGMTQDNTIDPSNLCAIVTQ
jgi:hypothetical protein